MKDSNDEKLEDVPWAGQSRELLAGPAPPEVLAYFARRRKIRAAVRRGLPQGAERLIPDPVTQKRLAPKYHLPRCPECKRTVRHHGRCTLVWKLSLKPTKTYEDTSNEA